MPMPMPMPWLFWNRSPDLAVCTLIQIYSWFVNSGAYYGLTLAAGNLDLDLLIDHCHDLDLLIAPYHNLDLLIDPYHNLELLIDHYHDIDLLIDNYHDLDLELGLIF